MDKGLDGLGDRTRICATDTLEWERWRVRDPAFCELGVVLPQYVLNSMRKSYLPGDFVYHLSGGGLHGSTKHSSGMNPKYSFLTTVCKAIGPESTPAQRAAMETQLAIFTDRSRASLKQPWPPLAQHFYRNISADELNSPLQKELGRLVRLQVASHLSEYSQSSVAWKT